MLVKKLITLAGALGILACGACFLPPPEDRHPPPPPLTRKWGVKLIRVEVTNSSETHYLVADRLATATAMLINERSGATGVKARAVGDPGPVDAVLAITVLREEATSHPFQNPALGATWTFQVTISANLMKSDGHSVPVETLQKNSVNQQLSTRDEAEAWKKISDRDWVLPEVLGGRFMDRLLYGK